MKRNLELNFTSKFGIEQEVFWMRYNHIVKAIVLGIEFGGAALDKDGKVTIYKVRYYVKTFDNNIENHEWIDEPTLHASKDEIVIKIIENAKSL